jgi:mitochondrial fission protein ELM1
VSAERPVSPAAESGHPIPRDSGPRVWLLTGFRAGDKAQMVALAEALGWPFEIKRFAYKPYEFVTNILFGLKRAGVDWRRSDELGAPWPDLVITAGRRNEPIARWIKQQSQGRCVIVHLGRPWSKVADFDLVITTPQYNVPLLANVLQIDLPLHGVTRDRMTAAAENWRSRITSLPRPWIAVMVGGDAPPYVFDARMARCLGEKAAKLARQQGGSLLVATSPRTKVAASDALETAIDVPCHFYRWSAQPENNPYLGFLGLADQIIVTGDSMSMVAEACATGKPVYFFDLGYGWTRMRASGASPVERTGPMPFQPKRLLHWLLFHGLPRRIRRDMRNMLRPLVSSGRAAWLGDNHAPGRPAVSGDLARAATRVKQVFEQARRS